jgi:hypothetical protein
MHCFWAESGRGGTGNRKLSASHFIIAKELQHPRNQWWLVFYSYL